jgi:hypothetical protein
VGALRPRQGSAIQEVVSGLVLAEEAEADALRQPRRLEVSHRELVVLVGLAEGVDVRRQRSF